MPDLQWRDFDFERNRSIFAASRRTTARPATPPRPKPVCALPTGATLRDPFVKRQDRCLRLDGELIRASRRAGKPWPKPRRGGGGPLLYSNYRTQIWKPFLAKPVLPEVTPHCAAFVYIYATGGRHRSGAGGEVGRHSNPAVTLGIYTQAMRGATLQRKRWSAPRREHPQMPLGPLHFAPVAIRGLLLTILGGCETHRSSLTLFANEPP